MQYIFHRTRGKLTKSETPYPVHISEVRQNGELVAYAQEVSSLVLQSVLLSLYDATLIADDPDWKGPRA